MTPGSPWTLLIAALIGAIAGTHVAIWGMYKDAIHEGFSFTRLSRSIFIGALVGAFAQAVFLLDLPRPSAIVILFGVAYAAERGLVEVWKTFFRDEDQSKYFIPMQFTVRGEPVSRHARLAAGIAYAIVVALVLFGLTRLDRASDSPRLLIVLSVGVAVGVIAAIGGAWKDAPKEGFELLKFFRSPIIAIIYALLLSRLTSDLLLIAAGAIGYERATAETYKTFFFPSKPRGKFAGKPVLHPEMLERRRYFVPVYVGICVAILATGVIALSAS
jgi:hypothetical protein